ncbi:MAG: hypothetical protein ACFFD4_17825 [Candidatus Odinarchaeota archaeon]
MKIETFDDLPGYLKEFLGDYYYDSKKAAAERVHRKIPALGNKSIIEVINERSGERKVAEFLNRAADKCGVPYYLEKNTVSLIGRLFQRNRGEKYIAKKNPNYEA